MKLKAIIVAAASVFLTVGAWAQSCTAGATISGGAVVDCGGKTLGLSCKSDSETQPPVLTINNGTVKNLVISATGASDGIHCKGGTCNLQNVKWLEVCEDAASVIADNAKMVVTGGSAVNTNSTSASLGGKPDKFFQVNNKNTSLTVNGGFVATIAGGSSRVGKLARTCGDCTTNLGPRTIVIDNVTVKGLISNVVGVNSSYTDKSKKTISGMYDTATITRLKVEGYKISGTKSTPSVCDEYIGVQKGYGSSSKVGQAWNTRSCKVSTSNVSKL